MSDLIPMTVRFSAEVKDRLDQEAELQGITVAELVRARIEPPLRSEAPTDPSQHESALAIKARSAVETTF